MIIKDRFANELLLESHIDEKLPGLHSELRERFGEDEVRYKKERSKQKIGVTVMLTAFIIPFFFHFLAWLTNFLPATSVTETIFLLVGLLTSFSPFILVGYGIWMLTKVDVVFIEQFDKGVNEYLFSFVFSLFSLPVTLQREEVLTPETFKTRILKGFGYAANSKSFIDKDVKEYTIGMLDQSELITEKRNKVIVDDVSQSRYEGRGLVLSELDVRHVTRSGKNRQERKIFKGLLVSFELERELGGKTFVSTEGDRRGFGHQSFFSSLHNKLPQMTELEWNDFESLLHVTTTDETESRYILSTDFMSDLYDWWVQKQANIRISFIDNHMHVLFPDQNIRMDETVKALDSSEVKKYVLSIAVPLLHIMHLVEDVKL